MPPAPILRRISNSPRVRPVRSAPGESTGAAPPLDTAVRCVARFAFDEAASAIAPAPLLVDGCGLSTICVERRSLLAIQDRRIAGWTVVFCSLDELRRVARQHCNMDAYENRLLAPGVLRATSRRL